MRAKAPNNQDGVVKEPSATTNSIKAVGKPPETNTPEAPTDAQSRLAEPKQAQTSTDTGQSQEQPATWKTGKNTRSETKKEKARRRATDEVLAILTQNLREGWKPFPDYDRHVDNAFGDAIEAARNARELLRRHLLGRKTTVLGYYLADGDIGS